MDITKEVPAFDSATQGRKGEGLSGSAIFKAIQGGKPK